MFIPRERGQVFQYVFFIYNGPPPVYTIYIPAVPVMQAQKHGHIINMSSVSGTVGYSAHSAYSAAKGAIIRLTEALADELKSDNIAVNAICPNAVDTSLFDEWIDENQVVLDRTGWIQPEEIGELAVFLCSPGGRSITGECVVIKGMYQG